MKQFFIYLAKNAVNAGLLALAPIYQDPSSYNLKTHAGLINVLEIVGYAVLLREGMIIVPKLLKWSTTNGANLMKFITCLIICLMICSFVQAQQQPPQTPFEETSVSFSTTPITLPGAKTTLAAAETDLMWRLTNYNHVGPTTLIGTEGLTFIGGRYQRVFPSVSNWIQQHTNFQGANFEAGLTASLGAVRGTNTPPGGYWGERAGGFINYKINDTWSMGADVEWNNFPGWQHNIPSIAFGPLFHF